MKHKSWLLLNLIFFSTLACNITVNTAPAPIPSHQAPIGLTQVTLGPGDTVTPPPPTPTSAPTITVPPPSPALAPSPTKAPPTAAPAYAVSARLVKDANCRAGPSTAYDVVTSFSKGQVLQIVGRNPDLKNTWWLVVIPGTNSKCWISLVTAQATGDFDSLPIIHPPY